MKSFILLLLTLAWYISSLFAQQALTAEEIIDKHLKAHGGLDAWNNVKTIEFTGTFTGFSIANTFKTIQKAPNFYRSDFGLGKFDVTLAYNGTIGWTVDPWFDINFPRELGNSELNVVKQKAEICSPFLNYKQKGYKIDYLGEVMLEGQNMHKIKLIRDETHTETWYLNANTFLEFKQESLWDDFGYTVPQETYFDDFRTVDGLVIPHYIERSFLIRNRITEIDKVIINKPVDNSLFEIPQSTEMEILKHMEGNWIVKAEALGRRGWYTTDSVSAKITKEHNLLETKLSYTNYFKYNKRITWSYNKEGAKYNMSVFDSFSSSMNYFDGLYVNDTLSLLNTSCSDSISDHPKTRYQITPFKNNQFSIEIAQSKNGKDWLVNEKLYFIKQME